MASSLCIAVLLLTGLAAANAVTYGPGVQPGKNGPEKCPAGTAKGGSGAFKCGACSGARFQPNTGATSCLTCASPNTANAAHTTCTPGPGYQPGTGGVPEKCPAGTAKGGSGAFKCGTCTGARYQPKTGATSCISCPSPNTANSAHTTCTAAAGYEPGTGGTPQQCPAGTAKGGAGNFACGPCGGTTNGLNRYSPNAGATACSTCPAGYSVDSTRTRCFAPPPPPSPPPGGYFTVR